MAEQFYLETDGDPQQVLGVGIDVVVTIVDGKLRKHPITDDLRLISQAEVMRRELESEQPALKAKAESDR